MARTSINRGLLTRASSGLPSSRNGKIVMAVAVGVIAGCVLAFLYPYPYGFVHSSPHLVEHTACESSAQITKLKSELSKSNEQASNLKSELSSKYNSTAELRRQLDDLTTKLRRSEQSRDHAEKQLDLQGMHPKAGPYGTVKALRTNPTIVPDDSVNPELAKLLLGVAKDRELIVTVANSNVKDILEFWFENIKRAGVTNFLVVALDDHIESFCKSRDVPVYRRNPGSSGTDSIANMYHKDNVRSWKFGLLREFLQLGYGVLFSDVDIFYLGNPFDHLYRDSDVESMSDGYDNNTAYGYDDVYDDPSMGWSRYAHTIRIWDLNSGFFYIRPTVASVEFLDRCAERLVKDPLLWDQGVFNEELFLPSRPGREGLHASKRTMDMYLFMNSKVLFKMLRSQGGLYRVRPVVVHCNYHPNKLERLKAIREFYVDGKGSALNPFPDGSE